MKGRFRSVHWRTPSGEKPFLEFDYGWQAALERPSQGPVRQITQDQLNVYIAWRGNSDYYWHTKPRDPRMFDGAWGILDVLWQMMHSVAFDLGSARYRTGVEELLQAMVPDDAVRAALWRLVREGFPDGPTDP